MDVILKKNEKSFTVCNTLEEIKSTVVNCVSLKHWRHGDGH